MSPPSSRSGARVRPIAIWHAGDKPGINDTCTTGIFASGSISISGTHAPWSSGWRGSSTVEACSSSPGTMLPSISARMRSATSGAPGGAYSRA